MNERPDSAERSKAGRERHYRPEWPPPWPEITDETVRQVIGRVPREQFVAEPYGAWAHDDRPLPIGHGQTISQPFIVALMTQALRLRADERVLEVGTGSGYQTAILAALCAHVDSVEIVPELAAGAAARLLKLDCHNVDIHVSDGYLGWPAGAPYDAIIVTAAPEQVPPALEEQLAVGGRLVIPVGAALDDQTLWLIVKNNQSIKRTPLTLVRFVPLVANRPE
ncbi:MAG: protein-L-isoaspartate(D-aspartate) O-methyltransferase [Anaerolineae bacterium]|uniref:protein-L-isoaspartate(D-aspartate) O-methyltransferase n=1 Tax=Candidatus Amarolinea dominans TaxID=3140696 RepID=UPI001E0F1222|nr:protein-L-isoaspartate(D-aspartate) O-methyltransferase [Anaerolineae bacterium]